MDPCAFTFALVCVLGGKKKKKDLERPLSQAEPTFSVRLSAFPLFWNKIQVRKQVVSCH